MYIGIDNGFKGGIVVIDDDRRVIAKYPAENYTISGAHTEYDIREIVAIFRKHVPRMVALEKAQSMPGQGVRSMFTIGHGFGLFEGILSAMNYPYQLVHPKTWQREILRDINKEDTKQASALYAKRMCPEVEWKLSPRCKKAHDGLTDAYGLAAYARMIH